MPTYQYKCKKCKMDLERMGIAVQFRDEQICDDCGEFLERQLIATNVSVWAPTSGGYR